MQHLPSLKYLDVSKISSGERFDFSLLTSIYDQKDYHNRFKIGNRLTLESIRVAEHRIRKEEKNQKERLRAEAFSDPNVRDVELANACESTAEICFIQPADQQHAEQEESSHRSGEAAMDPNQVQLLVERDEHIEASHSEISSEIIENLDLAHIEANYCEIRSLEQYQMNIKYAVTNLCPNGNGAFLNKLEMTILYLQIFSLLFAFSVPWPSWWVYSKYLSLFNLSIEIIYPEIDVIGMHIKFFAIVLLPVFFGFLYFLDFSRKRWRNYTLQRRKWILTRIKLVLLFITALPADILVCYLIDFTSVTNLFSGNFMPTWNTIALLCITLPILFFALAFSFIYGEIFRKVHNDDWAWFNYFNRYRQRFALFMILILYMPILSTLFSVFTCDGDKLKWFINQSCP